MHVVLVRVREVWPNEAAGEWMHGSNDVLDGAWPVDMVRLGRTGEVLAALDVERARHRNSGLRGSDPEYARAVEAERYWWGRIESEHSFVDATQSEAELIRTGRLLDSDHGGTYRQPAFQFDAGTGEVLPVVTALLDAIRKYQVPANEVIMWLCTPSAYFEEQDEPINHLHGPEGFLAAAHTRFGAQW